jgi:hypothetical protein
MGCASSDCKIKFTGGQGGKLIGCRCLNPPIHKSDQTDQQYVSLEAFNRLKEEFVYLQSRWRGREKREKRIAEMDKAIGQKEK